MDYSAGELFELLNDQDECAWIEAKGGHESSHSVMETVCAFSNEPNLGGGYILLGIAESNDPLLSQYKIASIKNVDKFQRDFASQCTLMFNIPVRPQMFVEKIGKATVIKVKIDELPSKQKPLYFKADGLPKGAYRRIGSTDQRCTEDDLGIFYENTDSYDSTPMKHLSMADIDENAIKLYRNLRKQINPSADELTYSDEELLQALGCVNKEKPTELNMAGLLLFGSSKSQRRTTPMLRVDYIRVPGNEWISDPNNRFTTIDMRGSLLLILYRLMEAINADLPKGFLLTDGIQASSTGLPLQALREALVNALMHRSYREHRPTQVIRYDNRIEIINPGYSLKTDEFWGTPGSETRNPIIAALFHETNLAETKGSGIRAMRRLMKESHLAPPTFESNRTNNQFVTRLLLHHFLGAEDFQWLSQFNHFQLTDSQKQALVFVREVGAIDNQTYRQMADCDILKSSNDLRQLKNWNILSSKGKGKATYYVAGQNLNTPPRVQNTPPRVQNTPPRVQNTPPRVQNTPPQKTISIPPIITLLLKNLRKKEDKVNRIEYIVSELCRIEAMKASEIAHLLNLEEKYFKRKYLSRMIADKKLRYKYPEMLNHPEQAYITNE